MPLTFGPRRGTYAEISSNETPLRPEERDELETFDLVYRSLCALLYNYVPQSGHPGGSISSGRMAAALAFAALDYDVSRPDREDADVLCYAAGHKAMGLYSLSALRDEVMRLAAPELLPADARHRLRLEDLLGFRRNPTQPTPLFKKLGAKALDGHPTPATPFVRVATGASGVGLTSAVGLALGAKDAFGAAAPRVHAIEGEGGLTPGRVAEALAAAGTAGLGNLFVHVDWNQASIDSEHVCREGDTPGEYVQWTPMELFHLHDWNVVFVPNGMDVQQVAAGQRRALALDNGQPTAVVYRTVKGWQYGIQGRASHGAGHKLCSGPFHAAVAELTESIDAQLPSCDPARPRCQTQPDGAEILEECFWDALGTVRQFLEENRATTAALAARLVAARERLDARHRLPRTGGPRVDAIYALASTRPDVPGPLVLKPGASTTLRGELGRALQHYNAISGGAILVASADLVGSTSVNNAVAGFPAGYWNASSNPSSRLLALGGICEDAISGILAGLTAYGRHIGVGSSYGAFLAPLGHIAARLHAIGAQARHATFGDPYKPLVLVCAHAGLKTGEDGPTHADPQPLQLLQENFPPGTAITLTPWEPQEIWPLLSAAFAARPALIAPFVTRPNEKVLDRPALGLAAPEEAVTGVYLLRAPEGAGDVTVVLQESAVTYAFVEEALPLLGKDGIDVRAYSVASAELFDRLSTADRRRIFPEERGREAMGITGFTLATMYRWILSEAGRQATLHPYAHGHFLGSGQGERVLAEAGLDGRSQYEAIRQYLDKHPQRKSRVAVSAK